MTSGDNGGSRDPAANLRLIRNAIIATIGLVALLVVVARCDVDGEPSTSGGPATSSSPTFSRPTSSSPTSSGPTSSSPTTSEAPVKPGGFGALNARDYIDARYMRSNALDEAASISGYVADGDVDTVAQEISEAERPTDARPGATSYGNVEGTRFLQYPLYIVGLFPYGVGKTRVMVSKDYRTGLNHYHSYIGIYWVPTPRYSGPGDSFRGGGSGGGK